MAISKLTSSLAALSMLALPACVGDMGDPADGADNESLEQRLRLTPQLVKATDIPESGRTLAGTAPRYLILSPEAGEIDMNKLAIADEQGSARGLAEIFTVPASTRAESMGRDALLLVAAPKQHVSALCDRFQFAHEEADFVKSEGQEFLFVAPASNDQVHALCLLPPSEAPSAEGKGTGPLNYGGGSYTVRIKSLTCNDPRDWENWPYNGDEGRMRGFYDGAGGAELWGSDDVESGNTYYPNRYVHFTNNAQIELFDYDSSPWNASDKLGAEVIYYNEACSGDHIGQFDGSGGGHDWDYDMTYRVYGPNCPCQSQESPVYKSYPSDIWTTLSTTITNYTYYCSSGIYWRQAWGNRVRRQDSYSNTYNESCEMKTYVSSVLVTTCDHYQYGVAIGSPVQYGTCQLPPPDPCDPYALNKGESAGRDQNLIPQCP